MKLAELIVQLIDLKAEPPEDSEWRSTADNRANREQWMNDIERTRRAINNIVARLEGEQK